MSKNEFLSLSTYLVDECRPPEVALPEAMGMTPGEKLQAEREINWLNQSGELLAGYKLLSYR